MRAGDLLAIDVAGELQTLGESQLRGGWQVPAELVRLALRRGATRIEVASRRRRIVLRWRGAVVEHGVLEDLRDALDRGLSAAERQRAIAGLEAAGVEALLWAAAWAGARLRVIAGGLLLELGPGRGPGLRVAREALPEDEVEIRWTCRGLDHGAALRWTATACSFAPAAISVRGRPTVRGFSEGIYFVELSEPLPCRLGLTRRGVEPVLWLLRDGVVAGRAVIPGYPPFEAAVELGEVVHPGADGAALRAAVRPFVAELADEAMAIIGRLGHRLEAASAADRQRIAAVALRAVRRGLREAELREVPLIDTLAPEHGPLSVTQLETLALRGGGRLSAIGEDVEAGHLVADRRTTVRATAEVRDLLSSIIGVRWQAPPRRLDPPWRRWADRLRHAVNRSRRRLRGLLHGRALGEGELTPEEQEFLSSLKGAIGTDRIALGRGGGGVRETAKGLVIPRRHAAVRSAAALGGHEPLAAFTALLALGVEDLDLGAVRAGWQAAAGLQASISGAEVRQ